MSDILKIFSIFTSKQLKECYFIFFVMLIGAVLESVGIGAILPLISLLENRNYLFEHQEIASCVEKLGIHDHESFVILCSGVLIVLYLLKNAYITGEIYLQRSFARKYQVLYSRELFSLYLTKPYNFHIDTNTAVLLRNVNAGANYIFNGLIMPVFSLFTEIITAVAIWVMLILVDYFTAVVVAGVMGFIILLVISGCRNCIVSQGKERDRASIAYLKWVNQGLGGIKETKVLRKEQFFLKEFDNEYTRYAEATQRYLFLSDMPKIIIEGFVVTGLLLLIIIKLFMGNSPESIVPLLGVIALAAFRLMPSASRIVAYYGNIKNNIPFFEDVYADLMEIKQFLSLGQSCFIEETIKRIHFKEKLEVENVSFGYLSSRNLVLDDVSFLVPKGKFVGVVGPSGAGKTTFVDIMLGLLQPTAGKILCDGVDINKNIRAWQANLAYVPQDIYLIDGTVKENIALGLKPEDIDDALIDKVLHMAELYDFVNALPRGMETFVGERGVKLSGGQRQRIGIARALYQQPEVLILDEATSALDNETEKSITDTILKLKGQITIIAIAHRVSTLEQCDFKIKFENGTATRVD